MNLLIDTHVVIWWLENNPRLAASARTALSASDSIVFVSAASVWEIAIKANQGRLVAPDDLLEQIELKRWTHLPITLPHAIAAGSLLRRHGDPFDRMLIAQAQIEGLTIVTRDRHFEDYGVPILRA